MAEPEPPAQRIVVFAGPTLPPSPSPRWSHRLSQVELRPPAQRGDVLNALCNDPEVLVLLDGYYFTVPSVTHKEILYALEAGVRVIGGASMGALRAAELSTFGMEGVGWVFEQFRDGHLDGDDEVAVLHASEDLQYRPLTIALVDVRAALLRLAEEGLAQEDARQLVAAIKVLPFTERHGRRLQGLAQEHLGERWAAALEERLRGESIKERDALAALERALEEPGPEVPGPGKRDSRQDTATTFLGYFQEWHLEVPGAAAETRCTFRQAAHAFQVLHPRARAFVAFLRRRLLLAAAARRRGLTADPRRVEELRRNLDGALHKLHGGPLLPAPERLAEARDYAQAQAALATFGSARAALTYMTETLGLDPEDGLRSLEALLDVQDDLLPAWWIARGLACSTAFPAAVAVAREAARIHRAFQTWKSGARIRKQDLREMAAQLWECPADEVGKEAGARGLFDAGGFSPGFRDALELIAAAQRLPRAINDYPGAREALRKTAVAPLLFRLPGEPEEESLAAVLQAP